MTAAPRKAQWSTVEAIKGFILDKGLGPGEPMPTEAELCASLGVSRSSVREAMRTLASLDIVEVRHGHGTFVGQLSLSPLVSGLVFRSQLNPGGGFASLRDVVDFRIALDLGIAEELVELHRGKEHPELEQLVEGMRERTARGETFAEEDGAFHAGLLVGLDNTLVRQLVAALWEVHTEVVPRLGIAQSEDIQHTVEAHAHMLQALEAGDLEGYREAVVEHYRPLSKVIDAAKEQQSGPAHSPSTAYQRSSAGTLPSG